MRFCGLEIPTIIEDAGLIADAIVIVGGKDPHWDESAKALLEGIILHVCTWPDYDGERNLVTVWRLISRGQTVESGDKVAKGLEGLKWVMDANAISLEDVDPDLSLAIGAATDGFFDKPDTERGSVLSTLRRHVKFLGFPALQKVLTTHGFDLSELKTAPGGMTIYLCLPAGRMGTCNRWFRLLINMALEAMEREPTKPEIPVLMILEEMHILGHMQQLEVSSALAAGFGCRFIFVLQDLTQLKRNYKESWETFLGNAGTSVFFGNSDMTTLKHISDRCGQTSLMINRSSEVTHKQRESGAVGDSWSLEVRELLTPEEVARFFSRSDPQQRQLIIRPGMPPVVMQRIKYDKHELFRDRQGRELFDAPV